MKSLEKETLLSGLCEAKVHLVEKKPLNKKREG
jgi:hypothetical protein